MRRKTWFYLLTVPPAFLLFALVALAAVDSHEQANRITFGIIAAITVLVVMGAPVLLIRKVIEPVVLKARTLREDEARQRVLADEFRRLLASGPAVLSSLVMDPEPRMTFVSDNVETQLGITPAAFIANKDLFLSLVHPDDRTILVEALLHAVEHGEHAHDFRLYGADGVERWLHGELHAARQNDGPVQITGWWIDITESRRATEARELAREAAEAASRAKSDFLANMSHEIRTPMNGVMGMLELALDADMPPEQREYLSVAHSSAESLLSVINDVLDFSKIEAGKMELDVSEFRVVDALEDTLSGLALRAHSKGLELALHIQPEVPERIVGDIGRLRQVIVNLVGNAIKFTDRGEVLVRVGTVMANAEQVALQFSVSDTGIGIPHSKQTAIFEAFAQADTSTTRQYGGTGLGLAISTRLVRLMGGRIWVDSAPGDGSSFYFVAHFGAAASVAIVPDVVAADLADVPVLVVDDNATNRAILQGMLSRWGMKPTVVDGGAAALAMLRSEQAGRGHFRLLIVDAQMPEMDGFGFVEHVRGDRSSAQPAIMMLSSATLHDDARRCREIGIDLYLTKPIRAGELRRAIARLLGANVAEVQHTANTLRFREPEMTGSTTPVRVLLAEDNAVNRRLALALLERRNANVTVAVDGREALNAWAPGRFDVILMDIQMPELDGLEVTRMIRARETSGERVPIIALTARAMSDDRERCLAAGMDAYITKPLRAAELAETIARLTTPVPEENAVEPDAPTRMQTLDLGALQEVTGGDDVLAAELVTLFRNDLPGYLSRTRGAVDAQDARALREAAHALKGAARAIGAAAAADVAWTLERDAAGGDFRTLSDLTDDLVAQAQTLGLVLDEVFPASELVC